MADILVVEDNLELAELLRDFLQKDGFNVAIVTNGEDAVSFIKKEIVQLVVLDIMLPGIDGFAVCQLVREKHNTPIIIVSARVDKEDKLNGLMLGADDYIEKPYDIDILRAKINAIYRRNYVTKSNILSSGDLVIEKEAHKVSIDKKEISLNVKEFELLVFLVENKGKVLGKELIFDKIWGVDSFSEPSTLTVHIKWLRQKIEENPKKPQRIITVWGIGYKYEEG